MVQILRIRKGYSMTKKTLERIKNENYNVYANIESLKGWYESGNVKREVILAEIRGYLTALVNTGFITEIEKRALHCYITI